MDRGTAGAGNTIRSRDMVYKYVNTPKITRIDLNNQGAGSYDTGSNLTVLGSDVTPAAAIPALDNVQDNSLFVDKENARRYWFDASSDFDFSASSSGAVSNQPTDATEVGQLITSTTHRGKKAKSATFYVKRVGSPSGTMVYKIRKSSDNSVVATSTGTSASALSTSTTAVTLNFNDEVIPSENIRVTVSGVTGSSGNLVTIMGGGSDTVADQRLSVWGGSSWTEYDNDCAGKLTFTESWTRELYFTDNFSTYADQTSANLAWVPASNVAGRRVNISDDDLDLLNDSGTTNYAVVHDLGANAVSDSKWTLRFSADVTLSSGSNNWCYIGLFNSDQSTGGGDSQNFVAIAFQNDGANTKFWGLAGVGRTVNSGQQEYFAATGNGTLTSTKYYIQIRRLTGTSMDINIYTDADYSTLHDSMTLSGSAISLGDLRYIKFANNTTSGSGSIAIVMDDVKFRNGAGTI
jgi:hypothetical protein